MELIVWVVLSTQLNIGHKIAVAHPAKGIDAGCHIGYLTKDTERSCETENGPRPLGPGHDGRSSRVPPNAIHRWDTPGGTGCEHIDPYK